MIKSTLLCLFTRQSQVVCWGDRQRSSWMHLNWNWYKKFTQVCMLSFICKHSFGKMECGNEGGQVDFCLMLKWRTDQTLLVIRTQNWSQIFALHNLIIHNSLKLSLWSIVIVVLRRSCYLTTSNYQQFISALHKFVCDICRVMKSGHGRVFLNGIYMVN